MIKEERRFLKKLVKPTPKAIRELEKLGIYYRKGEVIMPRREADARLAVKYMLQFAGTPYIYGGDDPMLGFDCSGSAVEMLKADGQFKEWEDAASHSLYLMYFKNKVDKPCIGCLAFYGKGGKVSHVAICIDSRHILEAGGGRSSTTSRKEAIDKNAYLKIRTIDKRDDLIAICDPFLVP